RSSLMPRLAALLVLLAATLFGRSAYAGYTHYWTWHKEPSAQAVEACLADVKRVVETRRDRLADAEERTGNDARFELSEPGDAAMRTRLAFNGIGKRAHEPFAFPGSMGFNFCKTAGKPYDEIVVA